MSEHVVDVKEVERMKALCVEVDERTIWVG